MKKTNAIDFTLVMGCRINCMYCPQKTLLSAYYKDGKDRDKKLSFDNFVKILDTVEPGSTVSFAGMAEPFLNDRCADMICYAYEKGYKISLCTTLQGMTTADYEKISRVEFDRFVLHIPEDEKISSFIMDEEYRFLLKKVHQDIHIDYYSCHGTPHNDITDIVDMKRIEKFSAQDRAGNLDIAHVQHHDWKGRIVCYRVWSAEAMCLSWLPEVLPDGTVLLCCQDYGMEHTIGNILTQSWEDIFHGEGMKRYLKGLTDEGLNTICRRCECAKPYDELPPICLNKAVKGMTSCDSASEKTRDIVRRLKESKSIVSYGMGKLFEEHFFQEFWNVGISPDYLTDGKIENEGLYKGIKMIPVRQLESLDDVTVVLFLKRNIGEITAKLNSMGIASVYTIDQIITASIEISRMSIK